MLLNKKGFFNAFRNLPTTGIEIVKPSRKFATANTTKRFHRLMLPQRAQPQAESNQKD